jgi:drug/metabolite transporter (DMT)-like permease
VIPVAATSSRLDWPLFLALGGIWGSSYLFIKVGVDAGLPPLTLVMLRLAIGFGLLAAVVVAARERLPREVRTYGHLFVMGVLNMALPFALITHAEQSVDSALAATLAAAIPLVVVPLAAVTLRTERITANKLIGVAVGFVGVAILAGFNPADLGGRGLGDKLALVGATVSYALGAVYARRNVRGLRPTIASAFQVGFALAIVSAFAFVFEHPLSTPLAPDALVAVIWLGLLGSGVAYLVFFRLLDHWGATRTTLVSYLMPVVGIVLGGVVLHEAVDPRLLLGAALIIGGIVLVNRQGGWPVAFRRTRGTFATDGGRG